MEHSIITDHAESVQTHKNLNFGLRQLNHDQWCQLGLYQNFHIALFKAALLLNEQQLQHIDEIAHSERSDLSDCPSLPSFFHVGDKHSLIEQTQNDLEQQFHLLFSLTAYDLLEELYRSDWLIETENSIDINQARWRLLNERVDVSSQQGVEVRELIVDSPIYQQQQQRDKEEESILAERAERLKKSLEYIDPLQHISQANETLFTIRRLDLILTNLDGLVVKQVSFRDLLNLSADDFEVVFNATDRLGLTRRTDDGYLRLDFHGTSIARQERHQRLKTLSMIASRLRREDQLREPS